CIQGLEFPLTF
nr:immunoglobulin light chain junction region [Macaca mulatta]MOV37106.1 immunoglobulin light chain junction region [Macaca mulatta]MOV37449.1 immunoglobulin light chain junction region [Macaca mulatta]MOV78830.1 immunoglobulin light chain junction region [Macaca mulatta]MOV79600.1 immunoglobulin light chain junction region [Macaca mulatta]